MIHMLKKWFLSHEKVYVIIIKILNLFGSNSRIKGLHPTVWLVRTKMIDKGNGNKITVGKNCILKHCTFRFLGSNNQIIIGDNCIFNNLSIWIEDNENVVKIGQNTRIHGTTGLACIEGTTIDIGEDCMFSSNINFRTGDSHSVLNLDGERINYSRNIHIGNHVWIGQNAFIGKGTAVSDNSIVGAYAVVTRVFDKSNIAIGGNPAKIIKENVDWKRERI